MKELAIFIAESRFNIFFSIILVTLFFLPRYSFGSEITDTIVPLIEKFENVSNIDSGKFSTRQFNEIKEALLLKKNKIRIISYNMLFDINDYKLDEINRWPNRLYKIVALIKHIDPDIICSQELHRNQINDLQRKLGEIYSFYGIGNKNNEKDEGEIDGIFIKIKRFDLLKKKIWIIPAAEKKNLNTLTMLKLRDKFSKTQFLVFNTHLPFYSADQREYSIQHILKIIERESKGLPILLAGDFNSIAQRMDLTGMPFYDGNYIERELTKNKLLNTADISILGHLGPIATYTNAAESDNGISFKGKGVPGIILDHIFADPSVLVLIHAIEAAKVDNHFPSDHMPVIVDCIIR